MEENENSLWDEIRYEQEQAPELDTATVEGAEKDKPRWLPAIGDFLVELVSCQAKRFQDKKRGSRIRLSIKMQVVEPVEFAVTPTSKDTFIYWDCRALAHGEDDWERDQRIAFLTRTGLCAKSDTAGIQKFDFRQINEGGQYHRHRCVFEFGHRAYENDNGTLGVSGEARDFFRPWHPESFWKTPDCHRAPMKNATCRDLAKLPATLQAEYRAQYSAPGVQMLQSGGPAAGGGGVVAPAAPGPASPGSPAPSPGPSAAPPDPYADI